MKYIQLANGRQVKVDDQDYEELKKFNWHLSNGYACRHTGGDTDKRVYMHREILETPAGLVTDHINGDKLDNRRANLRVATIAQNAMNYARKSGSMNPYKGVTIRPRSGLWRARLRQTTIGYFKTPEDAKRAYDEMAREQYGDFAYI